MTEKRLPVYPVFAVTLALIAAAPLLLWPVGLLFSMLVAGILVMQTLILRFTRPEVLKRGLSLENWWDRLMTPLIAVCAVASAALSVYDLAVFQVSIIQSSVTVIAGIILMMSAFLIAAQSLKAQPPHSEEKYGEKPAADGERGPYDVVRHPMMLAVLLGGLSIPLWLSSGIGFIPAGIMAAAVFARVAAEDDWRFNNYEWFYDYTKEVSYRLIPFIW